MTTALRSETVTTAASVVTWHETAPDMWTSRIGKDIAGAVQRIGTFITTNARGDVVGTFDTLSEAQTALTAASVRPVHSRSRRPRRHLMWAHHR